MNEKSLLSTTLTITNHQPDLLNRMVRKKIIKLSKALFDLYSSAVLLYGFSGGDVPYEDYKGHFRKERDDRCMMMTIQYLKKNMEHLEQEIFCHITKLYGK